jgi:hypothetical protein
LWFWIEICKLDQPKKGHMKTFITAAFIFAFLLTANATHNRSGEITYKRIAPFTKIVNGVTVPDYTYSITVIKYTDDGPGIADRCVDTVYFGDGGKGIAVRVNGPNTCSCGTVPACGEIIVSQPGYIVKKNIYAITHTFAGAGSYIIKSSDPSRNPTIANIPNSVNIPFYIESLLIINTAMVNNSSPVLTKPPVDIAMVGQCFYHNPCAFDEEGDSLSYEITACRGQGGQAVVGYSFPNPSYGIDHSNGLISWCMPASQGEFQLALIVKEWRKTSCTGQYQMIGYVLRDFQVMVGGGTPSSNAVDNLSDVCIAAGKTVSKAILCNSQPSQTLTGALYGPTVMGSNPTATLTPASGSGMYTSMFTWPTNCSQVRLQPYQADISFTANITESPIYRSFNIYVVPPAPVIKSIQVDTSKVTIKWKSLKNCLPNLTRYEVYRKPGVNTWQHGACETGVPANSGFVYQSAVSANDSVHVDTDLWTMPNGSTVNYIVIAISDDCLESFADSVISLSAIVGLDENALTANDVDIFPNPFNQSVKIQVKGNIEGETECFIYTVDGKLAGYLSQPLKDGMLEIRAEDLPKGLYLLEVRTEKGCIRKKLLKE